MAEKFLIVLIVLFFWCCSKNEALAVITNPTFNFLSSSENFTPTSGSRTTLNYDSTYGNPSGSLKTSASGRNTNETTNWTWTGTWEDLGVPAGSDVVSIGISGGYTRVTGWTSASSSTIGPYKLRNNENVDQATLWSGRTITALDSAWQSIPTQSVQTVPSSISSSNSTIKLYLEGNTVTGNNKTTLLTFYQDQLSFTINYTLPVAISITTDGSLSFNILGLGTSSDSTSSGINDVETVRVDNGPANLSIRSSDFIASDNTWILGSINGIEMVKWEFSKDQIIWNVFGIANTLYSLETNVPESSTIDLFFRLKMPTDTQYFNQHTATVTIVASAP